MITVNKNEKISFNLQLIKSDGKSVETGASVFFRILDSSATIEVIPVRVALYNESTQSYINELDPSIDWPDQIVGTYLVVWSVANTDDEFNSVYTENLQVNIDNTDIQKILGLVHQNMVIDQPEYDTWHNLISARVQLFRDSAKTQLLATYRITADTIGPGRFSTWEQVEE